MADIHCFTSATLSYLDRARTLAETVRRHHPDWRLWLCLCDQPPADFAYAPHCDCFDGVVTLAELGLDDPAWIFQHDVVELCTAAKGAMLTHLLSLGGRGVIYLDPDTALLSGLSPIPALLADHSVVLTPHLLQPETEEARIREHEISALRHGIYNLGFLAVANSAEGLRFAAWWRDRLRAFCFDDIGAGLFTDQRWCDHVPALFDGVHILRDPGYNVACWNVAHRPVGIGRDGAIRVGENLLRFFHFSKLDVQGLAVLDRNVGEQPAVFELVEWYRSRLAAHAVTGLPPGWWAYGHYGDGVPIPAAHRRAYRDQPVLRDRFRDPFATGPGSLADHLRRFVP